MSALDVYLKAAANETRTAVEGVDREALYHAADIIWEAAKRGGRLHMTGIGKPAHVAAYAASLFSSVGIPTYFLHGTEAVHGSCGQLMRGDVVICISNSGETYELKATAQAIRKNGCGIIGIAGNANSWLYTFADVPLLATVDIEGGPLGRAPRTSILAEMIVLQALSVILQERRALTVEEYVMRHPGGMLGRTDGKRR